FGGTIHIIATNAINPGLLETPAQGLLSLVGTNLNLTRGTLQVDGFNDLAATSSVPNLGLFDHYWGVGTNTNGAVSVSLQGAISPSEPVQDVNLGSTTRAVTALNAKISAFFRQIDQSNTVTQVVFLQNRNTNFAADVTFQ